MIDVHAHIGVPAAATHLPEPERARIVSANALEMLGAHASRLASQPAPVK